MSRGPLSGEEILGEVQARKAQIEPLLAEYRRLAEADTALAKVEAERYVAARAARKAAGKALKGYAAGRPRRRARRAGVRPTGTRADQAVRLVTHAGHPGLTHHDIAWAMGIKPNYLYRVLPPLVAEGRLAKVEGRYVLPGAEQ